jgi:hypothetical protein
MKKPHNFKTLSKTDQFHITAHLNHNVVVVDTKILLNGGSDIILEKTHVSTITSTSKTFDKFTKEYIQHKFLFEDEINKRSQYLCDHRSIMFNTHNSPIKYKNGTELSRQIENKINQSDYLQNVIYKNTHTSFTEYFSQCSSILNKIDKEQCYGLILKYGPKFNEVMLNII